MTAGPSRETGYAGSGRPYWKKTARSRICGMGLDGSCRWGKLPKNRCPVCGLSAAEVDSAVDNIIDREHSGHAARTLIKVIGFPSLATFFTLLAQDRLVITGLPRTMKTTLSTAIMTTGIPTGVSLLQKLIGELDTLIRKNNP